MKENITISDFLKSAFQSLFIKEEQMNLLYSKAAAGDEKALPAAARLQEQLELHDFYQIDTRIEQAAAGLGLLTIGLECPVEKSAEVREPGSSSLNFCWNSLLSCCWMNLQTFWIRSTSPGWQTTFQGFRALFWLSPTTMNF